MCECQGNPLSLQTGPKYIYIYIKKAQIAAKEKTTVHKPLCARDAVLHLSCRFPYCLARKFAGSKFCFSRSANVPAKKMRSPLAVSYYTGEGDDVEHRCGK